MRRGIFFIRHLPLVALSLLTGAACVNPGTCPAGGLDCNPFGLLLLNLPARTIEVGNLSPVYPDHAEWGDYVLNDGGDQYSASGTGCTGSETTALACFHAGAMFYLTTDRSQCGAMSARDFEDILRWRCDDSSGQARFYSAGFQPGKRLVDFIDTDALTWKPLHVIVEEGDSAGASSRFEPWANAIQVDNNGILAAESVPGTIYLVTQDPAAQVTLDQSRVGYVVVRGLTHTGTSGGITIITSSANFNWIEGDVDLQGADSTAILFTGRFSELRGMSVANGPGGSVGIVFNGSQNIRAIEIRYANSTNVGMIFTSSAQHNRLSEVYMNNLSIAGQVFSGDNLIMNAVFAGLGADGLRISTADNTFINTTMAGLGVYGFDISGGTAQAQLFINSVFMNAGNNGMNLNANTTSLAFGFANQATAHNGADGMHLFNASTQNTFVGSLLVGNNGTSDCNITGAGTFPGVTAACVAQGSSSHTLTTGVDLSASFAGRITADDSANGADTAGTATFGAIGDWNAFENDYRGWGPETTGVTDTGLRAACSTTCRIYDWSLAASDSTLRSILVRPDGDLTMTHSASGGGSQTFLRNASEILDDYVGDEDGLCESNERCLFTPNIGAYQGHGELRSTAAFSDGTIQGVTLFDYSANGR